MTEIVTTEDFDEYLQKVWFLVFLISKSSGFHGQITQGIWSSRAVKNLTYTTPFTTSWGAVSHYINRIFYNQHFKHCLVELSLHKNTSSKTWKE